MNARLLILLALGAPLAAAEAATVMIHDATVHTLSAQGVLPHADILIRDGRIVEVGTALSAPAQAEIIEAHGRPVTPGLFGGLGHLWIEEIGIEPTVDDYALKLGSMRPEFDVTPAFNPDSVVLGVGRLGGITFAQLAPSPSKGGSIIAGQGALVYLDGRSAAPRALFVAAGGDANGVDGGSRAALYMLLGQAIGEARNPKVLLPGDTRLLTPNGRQALSGYLS